MDLHEALIGEVLSEELADPGLKAVNSLVGGCSKVNDSIVQPLVLIHGHGQCVFRRRLVNAARGIFNLNGELGLALGYHPNFLAG